MRLGSIAVLEDRTSGFACGKQRLLGPARWVMDLYRPAVGIPCDVPFPVVAMINFGVVQRIIHSSIALSILVGRTFQSENSRILKRWILKTGLPGLVAAATLRTAVSSNFGAELNSACDLVNDVHGMMISHDISVAINSSRY